MVVVVGGGGVGGWFSKVDPFGGFEIVALGDMYGDCNAETNADEGGDTRGEP